jgi:hypothetical protein
MSACPYCGFVDCDGRCPRALRVDTGRCLAGYQRHWFSLYGRVGVRSTTCVRCGAPNPKPVMPEQFVEDRDEPSLLSRPT